MSIINRPQFSRSIYSPTFLQLDGDETIQIDEENWQSFSDELNETFELPSISVPAQHVHWLLSSKDSPLRPYLATQMAEMEGIIPALESAHALAWIVRQAASLRGKTVVLNLSGRGDKDVQQIAALDG